MIDIVFCTDSAYEMATGIAMISVCENNFDNDIAFHIVTTGEKTDSFSELSVIANKYGKSIFYYPVDNDSIGVFGKSKISHISITTFVRLLLPSLLPDTLSKVLYLDCDIVVNDDLQSLWNINLPFDCPAAAVADAKGTSAVFHYAVETPLDVDYCNAGVLLLNLDCWRRESLEKKAIECAEAKLQNFPMMDQDILNYLIKDRFIKIPIKYNFQTLFAYEDESYWMINHIYVDEIRDIIKGKVSPVIIHYISGNKPWKNEWCPMREVWEKYKSLSKWKDLEHDNIICRFDRSTIYKDFIDTYWSDSIMFKRHLPVYLDLFKISNRFKHTDKLMDIGLWYVKFYTKFLTLLFNVKIRN